MLGELYTWAYRRDDPQTLLSVIENDLLPELKVMDFDKACAARFGQLQSQLLRQGDTVNPVDLMIAAMALAHDLTLVTHNTKHFAAIPSLRLADWLNA